MCSFPDRLLGIWIHLPLLQSFDYCNSWTSPTTMPSTYDTPEYDPSDFKTPPPASVASTNEDGSVATSTSTGTYQPKTVWDFDCVKRSVRKDGTKVWNCTWCSREYQMWNATKALAHLTKIPGKNIKGCTARIPEEAM